MVMSRNGFTVSAIMDIKPELCRRENLILKLQLELNST